MANEKPANIEIFERIAATTLLTLYEKFPVPEDLSSIDIGYLAAGKGRGEEEQFEIVAVVAPPAMSFLYVEGFFRYEPEERVMGGADFPQAVLTLKGLALLGAVPSTLDESRDRRPLIDQIRSAAEEGATSSISEAVRTLFFEAMRFAGSTALRSLGG